MSEFFLLKFYKCKETVLTVQSHKILTTNSISADWGLKGFGVAKSADTLPASV